MPGQTLHVIHLEVRVVQTSGRDVKPDRIAQAVADHLRGELVAIPAARSGKGATAAVLAVETEAPPQSAQG